MRKRGLRTHDADFGVIDLDSVNELPHVALALCGILGMEAFAGECREPSDIAPGLRADEDIPVPCSRLPARRTSLPCSNLALAAFGITWSNVIAGVIRQARTMRRVRPHAVPGGPVRQAP